MDAESLSSFKEAEAKLTLKESAPPDVTRSLSSSLWESRIALPVEFKEDPSCD